MLTLEKIQIHLAGQGSTIHPIQKLRESGLIRIRENEPMTSRDIVSVLIAHTSPTESETAEHVIKYVNLTSNNGCSFGEVLQGIFEADTATPVVTSVHVCQSSPWARIVFLDGNVCDFSSKDFKPCAIRQEVVITGGLISMLAFMLNNDTKGGWNNVTEK